MIKVSTNIGIFGASLYLLYFNNVSDELDRVKKQLFLTVPRPGPMEIEDESGLELATYVFKKKDRSCADKSQMTDYLMKQCMPLLEDESIEPTVRYFINELVQESEQPNTNYCLRFKEQLEYYQGSSSKLIKLFSTVPFNLLTEIELDQLKQFGRKKGEAIDFALRCFFAAVDLFIL